jgi:hypothetical protein
MLKTIFFNNENNFFMVETKLAELPEYRMLQQAINQIIENKQ